MLNDGTPIDLATRLRTMSRVLDSLVPESSSALLDTAVQKALEAVGRCELTEAMTLLEEGVQANPFWLRGYLLLATIYEHAQKSEPAISTIEEGLIICASGLRLLGAQGWGETLEQINGPAVHRRIRNHLERLRRYERMFRYRLAMLQVRCGSFDKAIEQWSSLEEEHCA